MKSKRPNVIRILVIFLIVWIVFIATDFARAKSGKDPVFCLSKGYAASEYEDYIGVFYTMKKSVEVNPATGESIVEYFISPWFSSGSAYSFSSGTYK